MYDVSFNVTIYKKYITRKYFFRYTIYIYIYTCVRSLPLIYDVFFNITLTLIYDVPFSITTYKECCT